MAFAPGQDAGLPAAEPQVLGRNEPGGNLPPSTFGDYRLIERIGHGGMGVVYKAHQTSLGRTVALKMLPFGPFTRDDSVKRFHTEAQAAARLQHPNIVSIFEVGEREGQHFFSMEYVDGPNLAQVVGNQPMIEARAVRLTRSIAEAVQFAHEHRILHRDLKPSNILLDSLDQPRVTDFGLAKDLAGDSELTMTGQALGSPSYMPPEQAEGRHDALGPPSDVYSLGAILYHLMTGRPPFAGESITATVQQVINDDPVAPRLLNPAASRDLEVICLKCLEKEPARRYVSAKELADELSRFQNDEPIRARPVSALEHTWRWCRRRPVVAALAATVLVLLASVSAVIVVAGIRLTAKEQIVRLNGYAADMRLVQQALETENYARALFLLEKHRPRPGQPDLRGWEWRYFRSQIQSDELFALNGHSNAVLSLAFSPQGDRLVTGDMDGIVNLWDLQTRRPIASQRHQDRVEAIGFLPDGSAFASSGKDGVVRFFRSDTMAELVSPLFVTNRVLALGFSENGAELTTVAVESGEGWRTATAMVWDWRSRRLNSTQRIMGWWKAAFSPAGEILVTGGMAGEVGLWNLKSGKEMAIWKSAAGASSVSSLAFAPNGEWLAQGEFNSTVRVWHVATQHPRASLNGHKGTVSGVAFSPDGKLLATASYDQTVRLWDTADWRQTAELKGQFDEIWSLAFSPRGDWLATGGKTGAVKVWPTTSRPRREKFSRLIEDGKVADVSHDGTSLVCSRKQGAEISLIDLTGKRAPRSWRGLESEPSTWAVAREGLWVAAGTDGGRLTVWNSAAAERSQEVQLDDHAVTGLAFSPDAEVLAAVSGRLKIRFLRRDSLRTLAAFERTAELINNAAFSGDGRFLAATHQNGVLALWNTRSFALHSEVKAHKLWAIALAFSPDGKTLATGGEDGRIKLWEFPSLRQKATLGDEVQAVWYLAWSLDGRRLVGSLGDATIHVWDVASGQDVATFRGHTHTIIGLRFTSDGNRLISSRFNEAFEWAAPTFAETSAPLGRTP